MLCATHFHELTTFFQTHHDGKVEYNVGSTTTNNAATVCNTTNDEDLLQQGKPNTESTPAGVMNMHASAHVDTEKNSVTMLYEILPGPAHHSYGIHVAQAANFPSSIIQQAQLIESQLLSLCK